MTTIAITVRNVSVGSRHRQRGADASGTARTSCEGTRQPAMREASGPGAEPNPGRSLGPSRRAPKRPETLMIWRSRAVTLTACAGTPRPPTRSTTCACRAGAAASSRGTGPFTRVRAAGHLWSSPAMTSPPEAPGHLRLGSRGGGVCRRTSLRRLRDMRLRARTEIQAT
jgi:hypothetical protein